MGYYTYFELSTKENKTYKVSEIISYMKKECMKNSSYYPFEYDFDNLLFDDSIYNFSLDAGDSTKWYDHDEEMIELSLQFPEIVFQLYGDGEENGDTWYKYYKNGKKQYCPAIITYEKYDESKLA